MPNIAFRIWKSRGIYFDFMGKPSNLRLLLFFAVTWKICCLFLWSDNNSIIAAHSKQFDHKKKWKNSTIIFSLNLIKNKIHFQLSHTNLKWFYFFEGGWCFSLTRYYNFISQFQFDYWFISLALAIDFHNYMKFFKAKCISKLYFYFHCFAGKLNWWFLCQKKMIKQNS